MDIRLFYFDSDMEHKPFLTFENIHSTHSEVCEEQSAPRRFPITTD